MTRIADYAAYPGLIAGFICLAACSDQTESAAVAMETMYSSIDAGSCTEEVDYDDPNETTYQLCPGVLGYSLIVRRVGSGRRSVDVRTPRHGDFPLDYQEYVTRHMSQLESPAEWRVIAGNEEKSPVALIIGVQAHEDEDEPQAVTSTYLAVAKITPEEICVTHTVGKGPQNEPALRFAAEAAPDSECMSPLPAIDAVNEL